MIENHWFKRISNGFPSGLWPTAPGPCFPGPASSLLHEHHAFCSFFKSLWARTWLWNSRMTWDSPLCGSVSPHPTNWHQYHRPWRILSHVVSGELLHVQFPADEVDTQLLQDATRKEALQQKQWWLLLYPLPPSIGDPRPGVPAQDRSFTLEMLCLLFFNDEGAFLKKGMSGVPGPQHLPFLLLPQRWWENLELSREACDSFWG